MEKTPVAHPWGIKQITGSNKKTDQHDSQVLAWLALVGYLRSAYVPHLDMLRNREIRRSRLGNAYQSTRAKTRIRKRWDPRNRTESFLEAVVYNIRRLAQLRYLVNLAPLDA